MDARYQSVVDMTKRIMNGNENMSMAYVENQFFFLSASYKTNWFFRWVFPVVYAEERQRIIDSKSCSGTENK